MRSFWVSALTLVAFALASLPTAPPAEAGNCNYSWQKAKDGSSCGNRAASRRPGGR